MKDASPGCKSTSDHKFSAHLMATMTVASRANFIAHTSLRSTWKQHQICIQSKLRWKSEMDTCLLLIPIYLNHIRKEQSFSNCFLDTAVRFQGLTQWYKIIALEIARWTLPVWGYNIITHKTYSKGCFYFHVKNVLLILSYFLSDSKAKLLCQVLDRMR